MGGTLSTLPKAGIHSQVRCDHRSVADIHVFVSENAMSRINHTILRRIGDHASSKAVRRARNIEQDFRNHAHGSSAGEAGELFREFICLRNIGRYLITAANEKLCSRALGSELGGLLFKAVERSPGIIDSFAPGLT